VVSRTENGGYVIEADPKRCPFRKTIKCLAGEVCTSCGIYREANRIYDQLISRDMLKECKLCGRMADRNHNHEREDN